MMNGVPGSVAGAMRPLLVTVDGRCFCASFHWRRKTGSTRASSATPRTNVVTSAGSNFLMSDKTPAAADLLTGRARWRSAALGTLLAAVLACDIGDRRRQQDAVEWTTERTQMVNEQL